MEKSWNCVFEFLWEPWQRLWRVCTFLQACLSLLCLTMCKHQNFMCWPIYSILCWLIYFSAFKDSLNISPVFPFHPDKKPDQGILKSTPEGGQGTPQQTLKPVQSLFLKQGVSSSSAKSVLRGQHGRGGKSSGTPVSALTLQHKKKPVMKLVKRAKAADFFSS